MDEAIELKAPSRAWRRALVFRLLALIWAGLSVLAGIIALYTREMAGFPDGHRTAYQEAIASPLLLLALLCFAQGLAFTYTALRKKGIGAIGLSLGLVIGAALIILPSLVLPQCPWLSECRVLAGFLDIALPDHGVGG